MDVIFNLSLLFLAEEVCYFELVSRSMLKIEQEKKAQIPSKGYVPFLPKRMIEWWLAPLIPKWIAIIR